MTIDFDLSTGEQYLIHAIVAMMDNNVPFTMENLQKVSRLPQPVLSKIYFQLIDKQILGTWGTNISAPIT